MLNLAIRVVEAARGLKLEQKNGRTAPALGSQEELLNALSNLKQAIDNFDDQVAFALPALDLKHRPDFATPPQIDDEGVNDLDVKIPTSHPKNFVDLDLQDVSINNAIKPELKKKMETFIPKPVLAAAVMTGLVSKLKPDNSSYDLGGDGVFYDGDESAADLMLAMEAINDKLTFAVSKVGWTPRLRAMAEAMRTAQNNSFIEVKNGQNWVRVPAHSWGTLTVSIAEAALDQDLTIALPQPKPRATRDLDETLEAQRKYAPRPPV